MNRRIIGILVGIGIVVGGAWLVYNNSNTPPETGPIKIGFIAPLTGDAAAYGEPIQRGVQLAVKQINDAGGVKGQPLEVIYEDGKCTGTDSASAAQKLINVDEVKYIIGGVCSSESFSIVPIAEAAKVLEISPGSSAPKLAGISPYFVRNNPNDNLTGATLIDHLAKTHKKVAIISERTEFAQGIKSVMLAEAQTKGMEIVISEDYDAETSDFRTILAKVKQENPDIVIVNPQTSANLIRIAQQARQLGITTQLACPGPFNDAAALQASVLDGTIFAIAPGLSEAGKGPAFIADYKATYDSEPAYAFYAGAAYDDVYLIMQAIEAVGNDSTKVANYMRTFGSFEGTIGTYSFGQDGDLVGIPAIIEKIEGGKSVRVN